MGVYVDIDLDYLVTPIQKTGTNNHRHYRNEPCQIADVDSFVTQLEAKGLLACKDRKFFTNHRKSYTYWWIRRNTDRVLVHVDAHSDLYRNRNKDLMLLGDMDMGCDDFIWYALREAFVTKVYWVVPPGAYNLKDKELALKFIDESMVVSYESLNDRLELVIEVVTRYGARQIEYTICELSQLPCIRDEVELITVAGSPEFVPEASDAEIFRAMRLLGAEEDELDRLEKMYNDML